MKRILHIQVLPQMAGGQRMSLEILKSLPDQDFEKFVLFGTEITGEKRLECQRLFESAGVKVIYSSKLKRAIGLSDIGALFFIYKLCKRFRFDIVHTHSTKPGIIGRIGATLARVPYVIHTVHGLAFHKFLKFPKWQFYWLCEMFASFFCDRIILVNRYYSRYFKWFKSKTSTIYNGVDLSKYLTDSKKLEEKSENKEVKILFVGRLDVPKDPLTLLKAARIVIEQTENTRFTIVGNGMLFEPCQRFIRDNNLESRVVLANWHEDTLRFYRDHDIFVTTSIYEAFGLVFVEAGCNYLPTVATNVEGIPEVVKDGETGLLTDARNYEGVANHLLYLVRNPQIRKTMGQNAYNWVTATFSAKRMAREYLDVYNAKRS